MLEKVQDTPLSFSLIFYLHIENVEVERCYPDEFLRCCGTPLQLIYGDLSETCRQCCNDMENCFVAQWHPGEQVWADEPRTTCWLWAEDTEVCNWGGAETIDYHPGAQMFSCRPASYSWKENNDQLISQKGNIQNIFWLFYIVNLVYLLKQRS